jgi:hypothetical protein
VNNAQADVASNKHLDKGPGSPNVVLVGEADEELTPASSQASTNANIEKCDSTGATIAGMMNLNNARDTGPDRRMSKMNDTSPEASSIPAVMLTNSLFPSLLPSPPPVVNADSGFGHAATEELCTTPGPALTNLSELSQYQDDDLSSSVTFDEYFPPQPTVYQMPSDAWFDSILSSLPLLPTTSSNPPTSNLHPIEPPQGTQPDTTVQELSVPNPGTLLFLPDASSGILKPSPKLPSLAHSEEDNPAGSLVEVAGQAGRGKKRKGNGSELDDGPGSNRDSASKKGRGNRKNRNGVAMDMVATAADVGAAVTETRSRRTSNLPAHLREAGYTAPKRGKRVKT